MEEVGGSNGVNSGWNLSLVEETLLLFRLISVEVVLVVIVVEVVKMVVVESCGYSCNSFCLVLSAKTRS